jgi:hypothetical protein
VYRVTTKIAEEIRVLFQHHGFDAGPAEQIAEHHSGRTAADDAALYPNGFGGLGYPVHTSGLQFWNPAHQVPQRLQDVTKPINIKGFRQFPAKNIDFGRFRPMFRARGQGRNAII